MKTGVDRLLLVLIMEKKFRKYFVELKFPFSKPNIVYLRPFLTSLQFPKFFNKNFYVLWTKTCRNIKSIKFAN